MGTTLNKRTRVLNKTISGEGHGLLFCVQLRQEGTVKKIAKHDGKFYMLIRITYYYYYYHYTLLTRPNTTKTVVRRHLLSHHDYRRKTIVSFAWLADAPCEITFITTATSIPPTTNGVTPEIRNRSKERVYNTCAVLL